jgi:uncharacterized protein
VRQFTMIGSALAIYFAQLTLCDAASFNCQPYLNRATCPEASICSEPGLSRLDDVMASLYEEARDRLPASMVSGFRDFQREWLAKRKSCDCDVQCLDSEYRTQIEALRKTLKQMNQ